MNLLNAVMRPVMACAADCMRGEDWIAAADSVLNKKGMETEDLRQALEGLITPPVTDCSTSATPGRSRAPSRWPGYACAPVDTRWRCSRGSAGAGVT